MGMCLQANSEPLVLTLLSLCKRWHFPLPVGFRAAGSRFTVRTIVLGMKDGPFGKLNLSFREQAALFPLRTT